LNDVVKPELEVFLVGDGGLPSRLLTLLQCGCTVSLEEYSTPAGIIYVSQAATGGCLPANVIRHQCRAR
jgi:hypothetical protein